MANKTIKSKAPFGKAPGKTRIGAGLNIITPSEFTIILGILLLTFIAFFPSLSDTFVNWDDFGYLRDNPIIKNLSWQNIRNVFDIHTYVKGNYHPFTILSYCLEYHFVKLRPFLYHFDNLLLHLFNVAGVYIFVKLLFKSKQFSNSGVTQRNPMIAAITSFLFGIHPLRVESVTWVSERKDVLYAFFFIASLCCYLVYLQKTTKGSTRFFIAAWVLFFLSVLSKGQAVVLAPVLLLIDYFIGRKWNSKLWLEKIPFFALAIVSGLIAVAAQHTQLTEQRLQFYTFPQRLFVMCYGLVMYLYKLVLPYKLSCFYPYPDSISGIFFIAPVIVLALFLLLFIYQRKNKAIIFGTGFFLITISIVLQLLPVGDAVIAERYTYLPYLGLFFVIGNVFYSFLEQKRAQIIVVGIGATYLLNLLYLTFNQTKVWENSRTLWSSVLENYPETAVAYNDRGLDYYENKEYTKALADFDQAIHYKKDNYEAYNSRGLALKMLGKYNEAITDFKESAAINPEYFIADFNTALAYMDANKPDSAIRYFQKAIQADPQNASYYYNLAITYSTLNDTQHAIDNYSKAIALNPGDDASYNNRGFLYSKLHEYDSAINDFTHSLEINKASPLAYANRSAAYYEKKDYKNALSDALRAKELGNNMGDSYMELLRKNTQ